MPQPNSQQAFPLADPAHTWLARTKLAGQAPGGGFERHRDPA